MGKAESGCGAEFAPSRNKGEEVFAREVGFVQADGVTGAVARPTLNFGEGICHMDGGDGSEPGRLAVIRMLVKGHRFHDPVAKPPNTK
jgi:hypothetical protein